MNRAFKVIFIGISRKPERIVVIMYNNVDIISETYEDIASGKLQKLPRFDDAPARCAFEYLEIIYRLLP